MLNEAQTRAWIEVNLDALRANHDTLRRVVGATRHVIPMVKADAYGLGMERVVEALAPLGPWGWGVATASEGVALRACGVAGPIVVFTPLAPEAVEIAARNRLTACISHLDALDLWAAAANRHGPLAFHVEIDTGMGRAGFDWRETSVWGSAVRERIEGNLTWEGVFTHFHGADAPETTPSATQWERFRDAVAQLPVSREDLLVHAANSAAALRWPEFGADAVRPGIFLFGGNPAPGVPNLPVPQPVAAVRARLVYVRQVPPGSTVGYGATHISRAWEHWGTVAIGYGDGLPRALGNRGHALVRGSRVPIVGRISMDMMVVDISAVPEAEPGDVVTLIGRDGGCEITVDEVAALAGTISYEILTGFTPRLPRVTLA
jgi:alanine racemase